MRANAFNFDVYGVDMADAKRLINSFLGKAQKFQKFKKEGYGLFIWSKTKGTGKTMLACVILNEAVMRHMTPARFITVYDYLDMVTESWKDKTGDISARLRDIENTPLLVLDDIGVQSVDKLTNDKLFKLIDKRYNKKLVTIYTSNKKIPDLGLDDRITSRISAKSYVVHLPEVSIRQKKEEEEKTAFLSRLEED